MRTEQKYICKEIDLTIIENQIKAILKLDSHIDKKLNYYKVHSLYYDDIKNNCLFDNDIGYVNRFKYRIRYYDDNIDYIVLEKKIKKNGLSFKKTAKISYDDFLKLYRQDYIDVFWKSDNKLIKEFCLDCINKIFRPKIIIDYVRTAYVEPSSNIPITFDRNISGSLEINHFLDGNYTLTPLQQTNVNLLEIKYDSILPSYIKLSLNNGNLQQTTFSKYYLSRCILERN